MAELIKKVEISAKPGAKPVVAMALGPDKDPDSALPELQGGDRLAVFAEVEVTTDLTPAQAKANAPDGGRPTGEPYDYAPAVVAELLLARSPKSSATKNGEARRIGKQARIKLTHDQHHAVIVFDGEVLDIPKEGPGWKGDCYVTLALSASHDEARAGQVVLVGQNEFDGSVVGDMATLSVLRARPAKQTEPASLSETKASVEGLPVQGDVKRVIYSLPLHNLKADEQLRIRADVKASAKSLGYAGRLKTRVFLADSSGQLEPDGKSHAASVASSAGQFTKGNGFNCLPGKDVETYSKVGVLRIVKDARETLFVNVVGVAGDPEKKGRPDSLKIVNDGKLSVVRFPPEAFG